MLRLLLVAALAAALAAGAAAAPSYVIRKDNDIGGFTLAHAATLKTAVQVYGTPSSRQENGNVCTVRWNNYGIYAQFYVLYIPPSPCSQNACFQQSTLTAHQWRTEKGLRIGDTRQRLRKLYPQARREVGQNWRLISRPFAGARTATLLASLKAGRISAFIVRAAGLLIC